MSRTIEAQKMVCDGCLEEAKYCAECKNTFYPREEIFCTSEGKHYHKTCVERMIKDDD